IARLLMGTVFVVAGIAKSYEPVVFYWEAISYVELLDASREIWPQLGRLALVLAPLEVFIGAALIACWRPRIIMPVATAMIVLFIGVTAFAWQQEAQIDCGCFGTLTERTPGEALLEDLFMLALLLAAWRWGTTRWTASSWPSAPRLVMGAGVVALGLLVLRFAPESERVASSDLQPGVRLTDIELKGLEGVDLSEGAYLVEVFSPRCGRCKAAVPKLNDWADTPGLPQIIALNEFPPDSPYLAEFVEQMRPRYKIASISSSDFMRLTWRHGYPRLAYIEGGVIQRVWEHDQMPSVAQLKKLGAS
ncbi:MAG: thioredoxin family protein, partial [bacterium]|nr:thioredoxin family protein [bacterium]